MIYSFAHYKEGVNLGAVRGVQHKSTVSFTSSGNRCFNSVTARKFTPKSSLTNTFSHVSYYFSCRCSTVGQLKRRIHSESFVSQSDFPLFSTCVAHEFQTLPSGGCSLRGSKVCLPTPAGSTFHVRSGVANLGSSLLQTSCSSVPRSTGLLL